LAALVSGYLRLSGKSAGRSFVSALLSCAIGAPSNIWSGNLTRGFVLKKPAFSSL
jgi:hypothetical protein